MNNRFKARCLALTVMAFIALLGFGLYSDAQSTIKGLLYSAMVLGTVWATLLVYDSLTDIFEKQLNNK